MPMVNKYAGWCVQCKARVEAGEGQLERHEGKWVTTCQKCLGGKRLLEAPDAEKKEAEALAVAKTSANGMQLFPYQLEGVAWLARHKATLLADAPGLGKTATAICAIPRGAPVVVVCPAVVKGVWLNEFAQWRPELTELHVFKGRGSFCWPIPWGVHIVNYDILPEECEKANEGTVLIFDEAHCCKSNSSQRTKRSLAMSQTVRNQGGSVWLLTGTPMMGNPLELWNVLRVAGLAKAAFGGWPEFFDMFRGKKTEFGIRWGNWPKPEASHCIARVSLRRIKEDVLPQLPVKRIRTIDVENVKLSEEAMEAEDEIFAGVSAGKDLLTSMKEVPFQRMSKARTELAMAKIPAMLAMVESYEEQDEPLVVFSAHRAPIDALASRKGWAVITGDTSNDARSEIVKQFQAGELRGLALTIAAGGVGITLTRAAHALFVDQDWTPALNEQAEDRLVRIGQTRGVLINVLVAKCYLDQRLALVLSNKRLVIDGSVQKSSRRSRKKEMANGSEKQNGY